MKLHDIIKSHVESNTNWEINYMPFRKNPNQGYIHFEIKIGKTKMRYSFIIDVTDGKTTLDDIKDEIIDKVNSFDIDEETYNRLDTTGHGEKEINAPRSIKDVYECCEKAKEYLYILLEALTDIHE